MTQPVFAKGIGLKSMHAAPAALATRVNARR